MHTCVHACLFKVLVKEKNPLNLLSDVLLISPHLGSMLRVAVFLWRCNVTVPYFFHALCYSVLFICLACHCLYQFQLKNIIVCMICECGYVPQYACSGQKTTFRSPFSLFTIGLGIKLVIRLVWPILFTHKVILSALPVSILQGGFH